MMGFVYISILSFILSAVVIFLTMLLPVDWLNKKNFGLESFKVIYCIPAFLFSFLICFSDYELTLGVIYVFIIGASLFVAAKKISSLGSYEHSRKDGKADLRYNNNRFIKKFTSEQILLMEKIRISFIKSLGYGFVSGAFVLYGSRLLING